MKIPFLALIFQGIPEQIGIITLACVIAGITLDWKKIVSMSLIIAFTSYAIRLLPITFGIHTVILIGMLIVFLVLWCKGNLNAAIFASLITYLILIIAETVCFALLLPIFQVTPEMLTSDWIVRSLIGLPQLFMLFILAFGIHSNRRKRQKETYM